MLEIFIYKYVAPTELGRMFYICVNPVNPVNLENPV